MEKVFEMIRLIFCSLLLTFLSFGNCFANEFIFHPYTTEDGLAFNNVDHIYQDEEGILYFCTNNGLSAFDGTSFKNYNTDNYPGFSNKIFDIQILEDHKILLGTMDKGLFILDKALGKILKINLELDGKIISPSVSVLFTDEKGHVWLGCFTGEIYLIEFKDLLNFSESEKNIKCEEILCDGVSGVHSFYEFKGYIYIGTDTDVMYSIKTLNKGFFLDKSSSIPQVNNIYCFSEKGDSLILGTDNGLFFYYKGELNKAIGLLEEELDDNIIRSIIKQNESSYWIGTLNGLYNLLYKNKTTQLKNFSYNSIKKQSINSNYIISLYIDSHENLWIGTWFGGVNRLSLRKEAYTYVYDNKNENDIHSNILWCIEESEPGQYWIGSHGNGLCTFNSNDANFTSLLKDEDLLSISSLFHDTESGNLFIGSWGEGIKVLNYNTLSRNTHLERRFTELKNERVYSIVKDQKGTLWIGGFYNGLYSYSFHTGKLTKQTLKNFGPKKGQTQDVRFILPEERSSYMWLGSYLSGMYRVKTNTEGIIVESIHYPFFDNTNEMINLNALYRTKDGVVWILTGNGLGKIEGKGEDAKPVKVSLLDDINIKMMAEDNNGCIWIAGFIGLFRLDPKKDEIKTVIRKAAISDILFDHENNTILACTDNGILKIKPDRNFLDPGYPNIYLSSLRLFDKDVSPDEKIKNHIILDKNINYINKLILPHFCNSFSVGIRAVWPGVTEKSIISYKLSNIDTEWNNRIGTSTLATYTNLNPGKYELLIKTANEYKNWNPETRKILFILQNPWYLTKLALIAYFLITIVIVIVILKVIKERIRIKHKLKMEMVEHKRAQEFYEQKLVIFTNISHDIRTPLTLIKGPVEDLINDDELNNKHRDKLLKIHKHSELLLKLINQILNFRKIDTQNISLTLKQINISVFLQNIFNQFKEQAYNRKIDFDIELPAQEDTIIVADPEKLESIIYNLLSNALKFTSSYESVFVELISTDEEFIIRVKDTGIGIPQNEIHSVFKRFYQFKGIKKNQGTGIGLALVKKYVEMHKGYVHVNSIEKKGAEFIIHLPKNQHPEKYELYVDSEFGRELYLKHPDDEVNLTQKFKKLRVLVIDDNFDMREYLKDLLCEKYDVVLSSSGEKGIKIAKRKSPQLIICDIMMEGIDGIEVCRQLKSNLVTSHIPIILLTAKTTMESRISGFEEGAEAYIEKPFSSRILLARIKNIIESRQALKKKLSIIDLPASEISPSSVDEKFMKNVLEIIEAQIAEPEFSVQGLVDVMKISQDQLYRKIRVLTGLSINHFIRSIRLKKSAQLLKTGKFTVSEIVFQVGFNNASYFAKCFKEEFGMLPSEYIEQLNEKN